MNNAIGSMFLHGYIPTREALAAVVPQLVAAAAKDEPARWSTPTRAAATPAAPNGACLAC